MGLDSSMKTANDEGEKKGMKKVAKNLKDEGHSIPYIAKMTGLTEEEIKKL